MTPGERTTVVPTGADVLVLRALGLGDALTGVAPLRGIRRAWPERRLVLAAPAVVGGWLERLGLVDAVLPTHGLRPDWLEQLPAWPGGHVAVNLHGRGPQSHRLLQATRPGELVAFGCPAADHDGPPWRRDEHEVERWCRLLRSVGAECGPEDLRLPEVAAPVPSGAVVLHPGAASASRRWPRQRWAELARRLTSRGHLVVLTGSDAETQLCAAVAGAAPGALSLAGRLDLHELAALVASARLLICGDTGVAHLATALAVPSVLLFGPTPPRWWGPAIDPQLHTVLWHGGTTQRPPGGVATEGDATERDATEGDVSHHEAFGDPHGDDIDPALAAIGIDEVWDAVAALPARELVRRSG